MGRISTLCSRVVAESRPGHSRLAWFVIVPIRPPEPIVSPLGGSDRIGTNRTSTITGEHHATEPAVLPPKLEQLPDLSLSQARPPSFGRLRTFATGGFRPSDTKLT
jgi:hypothetical protein